MELCQGAHNSLDILHSYTFLWNATCSFIRGENLKTRQSFSFKWDEKCLSLKNFRINKNKVKFYKDNQIWCKLTHPHKSSCRLYSQLLGKSNLHHCTAVKEYIYKDRRGLIYMYFIHSDIQTAFLLFGDYTP